MAIQYVGGVTSSRNGNSNSTTSQSLTSLTGGIASQPAEGDLVIVACAVGSQGRNSDQAISGYSTLGTQLNRSDDTYDASLQVSYKVMTSSPDTSITIPAQGNVADGQAWAVMVFRGVDTTTPFDVSSVSATGNNTARFDAPAITPSTAGAWIVIAGAGASSTGTTLYTAPSGFTDDWLAANGADTNDGSVGMGYYTGWTSGSYNPGVVGGGSTNTANSWCAWTMALRPLATITGSLAATESGSDTAAVEGNVRQTLHYVIYPAALGNPSAAQIKAGDDVNDDPADAYGSAAARNTTGEQVLDAATGLTAATTYKVAFVVTDGTNDSNVAVSDSWSTWNSGSLAATESGSDTAAIAGDVLVSGALAATESGADTASIAGDVLVAGSLAATETGADVAAISGDVLVSGALAASESGADTAALTGAVVVSGALAAAESGSDTAAFAGVVPVEGALAATESGADTAAIVGAVRVTGTLAATESGQDTAHFTSQSVASGSLEATESGADTAGFTGLVLVSGSLAATEAGSDTAAFAGTVPIAAAGVVPAGRPSRGRRRRVVIGERVYEVSERDLPALIEAELLDRAPPVTATHIAGPKPPQKRRRKAAEPVKTAEQVRQSVEQIKERIEPDNGWLVDALGAVAQRVLERLQDEEESLMLLLAA